MWADASPNGAARRADPTAALRERIEVLEEENRQLRELLVPQLEVPRHWRLHPMSQRLLCALRAAAPGYISKRRAYYSMYDFDEPETVQNNLYQRLNQVRGRFRELGIPIEIETLRGRDYQMPPESVAVFDRLMAREVAP